MSSKRNWEYHVVTFEDGATLSNGLYLGHGCFGTLVCESGLNAKTLQVVTDLSDGRFDDNLTTVANFNAVNLLSAAKTLATGANAFTADEIREIGASGPVKFKVNSAVSGRTQALLWWKS